MNVKGFVVPPGQGAVWHMAAGRSAALKLLSSATAESVMIFEESTPPGTATTLHLHHDSDEVIYVLSGEVTFKIGDEVSVGGPGTCAFMPRGIPHAWKSTGPETGRVLCIYTPSQAGKFFEDMTLAQNTLASMPDEKKADLFKEYRWEIVGPPPF